MELQGLMLLNTEPMNTEPVNGYVYSCNHGAFVILDTVVFLDEFIFKK